MRQRQIDGPPVVAFANQDIVAHREKLIGPVGRDVAPVTYIVEAQVSPGRLAGQIPDIRALLGRQLVKRKEFIAGRAVVGLKVASQTKDTHVTS